MSKRKTIAVAIVLALVLLIGGMLAFFTDTDKAENIFTLGNVDISLAEDNWHQENAANLLPGATILKDPVVTNDSTTNPAFVFVEVIVPCYAAGDTEGETGDADVDTPLFALNTIGSGWNLMRTEAINTDAKTITYVYNYGSEDAMTPLAAGNSTSAVFSSVTLASTLTGSEKGVKSGKIVVNAYGIQTSDLGAETPSQIYGLFAN